MFGRDKTGLLEIEKRLVALETAQGTLAVEWANQVNLLMKLVNRIEKRIARAEKDEPCPPEGLPTPARANLQQRILGRRRHVARADGDSE